LTTEAFRRVFDLLVESDGAGFNQYASFLDPEMIDFSSFEPGKIPAFPTRLQLFEFYVTPDYELEFEYVDTVKKEKEEEKPDLDLGGIVNKKEKKEKKSEPDGDDDLARILKKEKTKEKANKASGNKSSWADIAEQEEREEKKVLKKSSGPQWKPKEQKKVVADMIVQTHVKDAEPKHVGKQPPDYENREKKLNRLKDLKERRALLKKNAGDAKGRKGKINFRDIKRRLAADVFANRFEDYHEDSDDEIAEGDVEAFQEFVDRVYDGEIARLERESAEEQVKKENEVFDLPGQTDDGDFTEMRLVKWRAKA